MHARRPDCRSVSMPTSLGQACSRRAAEHDQGCAIASYGRGRGGRSGPGRGRAARAGASAKRAGSCWVSSQVSTLPRCRPGEVSPPASSSGW